MEEHVVDLLPAYTLGCLDADELDRVIAHLVGCAACQAELRVYQSVCDQLGSAAPLHQPPAALKAKVMAAAQAPVQSPASGRTQRSWLENLVLAVTPARLAIAMLVLALAMSNVLLWQQVNRLQPAQNDFATVALAGTETMRDASGLMVISPDGMHGTLVVNGLQPLGASSQYQLWLIKDGQRDSGGVFSVDKYGYGSVWIDAEQPLASYQDFGITIEPAGGSPGPTGLKVLGTQ